MREETAAIALTQTDPEPESQTPFDFPRNFAVQEDLQLFSVTQTRVFLTRWRRVAASQFGWLMFGVFFEACNTGSSYA
jgi:hypothetical protein